MRRLIIVVALLLVSGVAHSASNPAPETAPPFKLKLEQKIQPSGTLRDVAPHDGVVLLARRAYQIKAHLDLITTNTEGVEVCVIFSVNGIRQPAIRLRQTSGGSSTGEYGCEICANGQYMEVEVEVVGKGIESGNAYHFGKTKRRYCVIRPLRAWLRER